jgi:hypothetical protein
LTGRAADILCRKSAELQAAIKEQSSHASKLRADIDKRLRELQEIKPPPPPHGPVIVIYKTCAGELRSMCPSDALCQYCGFSVSEWAKTRCASFTTQRLDSYGGNKCGYIAAEGAVIGPVAGRRAFFFTAIL